MRQKQILLNDFALELLIILNDILANRDDYPKLLHLGETRIKHNFYRLMSQYLYMGGDFGSSFYCLYRASRLCPDLTWNIVRNEGFRWFLKQFLTVEQYKFLSNLVNG